MVLTLEGSHSATKTLSPQEVLMDQWVVIPKICFLSSKSVRNILLGGKFADIAYKERISCVRISSSTKITWFATDYVVLRYWIQVIFFVSVALPASPDVIFMLVYNNYMLFSTLISLAAPGQISPNPHNLCVKTQSIQIGRAANGKFIVKNGF